METLIIQNPDHTSESLFKAIDRHRLRNRKAWWVVVGPFYGHHLEIKAYGTWAQIFRVDGVDHSFGHTDKVTSWKQNTRRILDSIEKNHT